MKNMTMSPTFMNTATVMHEQQSIINNDFPNVEHRVSELSGMCNGILEKVVYSSNQDVNYHYDTMPIWRTTIEMAERSPTTSVGEGYPMESVLAGWKCGEPFATLLCTLFTRKLLRLYNHLIILHV
jgi:hypothetical protein